MGEGLEVLLEPAAELDRTCWPSSAPNPSMRNLPHHIPTCRTTLLKPFVHSGYHHQKLTMWCQQSIAHILCKFDALQIQLPLSTQHIQLSFDTLHVPAQELMSGKQHKQGFRLVIRAIILEGVQ